MKILIYLQTMICLAVAAVGQTQDPTLSDPTVIALTSLLPLRDQAKFGSFLKTNHQRIKFAGFLDAQGRFASLANKEILLYLKSDAERPNYSGNAAAKVRKNYWLSVLEGKAQPVPDAPANTGN